jgi:hypothetical protein
MEDGKYDNLSISDQVQLINHHVPANNTITSSVSGLRLSGSLSIKSSEPPCINRKSNQFEAIDEEHQKLTLNQIENSHEIIYSIDKSSSHIENNPRGPSFETITDKEFRGPAYLNNVSKTRENSLDGKKNYNHLSLSSIESSSLRITKIQEIMNSIPIYSNFIKKFCKCFVKESKVEWKKFNILITKKHSEYNDQKILQFKHIKHYSRKPTENIYKLTENCEFINNFLNEEGSLVAIYQFFFFSQQYPQLFSKFMEKRIDKIIEETKTASKKSFHTIKRECKITSQNLIEKSYKIFVVMLYNLQKEIIIKDHSDLNYYDSKFMEIELEEALEDSSP